MADVGEVSSRRAYWCDEINKAKKRFDTFWKDGDRVIDEYRLQRGETNMAYRDKYNILYSSTETIRPNLYAQTPKAQVQLRHKDRAKQSVRDAVDILQSNLQYISEEGDFDDLLENATEDLLLPGLAVGWVRYEPIFGEEADEAGTVTEKLLDETVCFEYVYWQDFMVGVSRGWRTVPWVAKRCWLSKEQMVKRFGKEVANAVAYSMRESGNSRDTDGERETVEVWEIWDKNSKSVIWYCETFAQDVLDVKPDPLKLKNFFPCPRPLRAVSNTRSFVPRALYSQYKSQAETLNQLTRRIRLLTEALKVVGVYDASQVELANILGVNTDNKMVAVQSWVQFAQNGGIKGSIEWLPIEQVSNVLAQTLQAREICKAEIYEITGFSDIVRGVSKASETLGAQNIKANWASARVKRMQKEVQRFARDLISIAGEIISEHCSEATIAMYGGIDFPTPEEIGTNPQAGEVINRFKSAVAVLREEGKRCALVDIETDSTILADEEAERKDRMDFLGAAGAFLQQAVPAAQGTPELGPLLAAMLMFTVRTFPSSRPIEEEFEKVQKVLANKPPQQGNQDPNGHAAKAAATKEVAQIRASTDQARIAADSQVAQAEANAKASNDAARIENERTAEQNRHNEKMQELWLKERELELREREVAVKEQELSIKQQDADTREDAQEAAAQAAAHSAAMAEAGHEQEYDRMDRADANANADRMEAAADREKEGLTGGED